MDKVFSFEAFVHAIAGTAGGSAAMTTFYPLDVVRTYIQVDEKYKKKSSYEVAMELIREDGVESLYRGLGPTLFSLACSNFVYFYTNNTLKVVFRKVMNVKEISVWQNLFIASVAGCVNVLTTCPFWVVNTRLKVQRGKNGKNQDPKNYKGMLDGLIRVYQDDGLAELWSGAMASLVLVSNPTIQFVTYDKLKQLWSGYTKSTSMSALEVFVVGAIAKAIATIITYPLQLAQSKLRHGGHGKDKKKEEASTKQQQHKAPESTVEFLISVLKTDGFFGWFKGLNVKLLQTILMAAFHFAVYEKIAEFVLAMFKVQKKGGASAAH